MGSVLISVPDIADSNLIYSDVETRQILRFFWPHETAEIDALDVTNDTRRLAQTGLIAAIEGSYAMSFVDATFQATVRRGTNIRTLARKLATNFVRAWWRHTSRSDLKEVEIYESVRVSVARALKSHWGIHKAGASLRRPIGAFYAYASSTGGIWS